MTTQMPIPRKYDAQPRLTHEMKKELLYKVKRLYINKEFTEFIAETIEILPNRDKLAALYYFKKLAIQIIREPDLEHYEAFKDAYDEELSYIQMEQKHYEPVKWINAEIEYITNTAERLTAEDVNKRLDVMQEAKLKLSKSWLNKVEVMELFSISKATLNRRISEGMPAHKNGRYVYFCLDELTEWLKKDAA